MNSNHVILCRCLLLLCVTAPVAAAQEADLIKTSVSKSVALLQSCDETFFINTGCLGCHQQSITAMAVAAARERGLSVDEESARRQRELIGIVLERSKSQKLQRMESPFAQPVTVGYYALAFSAQGYEPDENTDAMIVDMAGRQTAGGFWVAFAHRPPMEFSRIASTAFAIKSMQLYGPPTFQTKFEERISRAGQWLAGAETAGNDEEVFKLLGLAWAKTQPVAMHEQYRRLLALQHENGGWAQLPELATDAYATSMAMYALAEAGMEATDPVYGKGVKFLLETQKPDGSWHVKSRSQPVQRYFESGFPHGPDQWISATATGWACIALLHTLK